jgi:hypothetical protein
MKTLGYFYFRFNGKRTELPGAKGSPEFDAAYDRLFAEAQRSKAARKQRTDQRNAQGGVASIEWFIQKFFLSEYFVGQHGRAPLFASGTQKNYRPVLERMCLDTVKGMAAPIGKAKLAEFTAKTARTYLHKIAEHCRPTVARTQLMLLSNLWQFAMRFDEFDPGPQTNPFAGIGESTFYTVEQEHEPWPEDVIERERRSRGSRHRRRGSAVAVHRPARVRCLRDEVVAIRRHPHRAHADQDQEVERPDAHSGARCVEGTARSARSRA